MFTVYSSEAGLIALGVIDCVIALFHYIISSHFIDGGNAMTSIIALD